MSSMDHEMKSDITGRLIIFTKYPEPGYVKTRLIPLLGAEGAAELHRRLTVHTLSWVNALRLEEALRVEIYFKGGTAELMAACFGSNWHYVEQASGDLGTRLSNALSLADEPTVTIGTDCPGLGSMHIRQAMNHLRKQDLVLGPATDGGYYLIGVRQFWPTLFLDIPWGTDAVCRTTQQIASALGLSVAMLEKLSDVDRPEDMASLNMRFTPTVTD
jgi:rSAM/selenodomain-associated transferase 1